MMYRGSHLVTVIDGLDGVEACYHFAGVIGVRPHGLTLRQLWRMASGRIRQNRFEMFELSSLVWGLSDIDLLQYLYFGRLEETGAGGPSQVPPDIQSMVDAEVEKIRAENPDLPAIRHARR